MTRAVDRTTSPFSVLIGEEDALLRDALCDVFHAPRFATQTARSGHEAVRIAREELLHLMIIDVRMPDLPGIDAYRMIRRFKRCLPCIFLSEDMGRRTRVAAMSESAYTLVRKPVDTGFLHFVVEELLLKRYGSSPSRPPFERPGAPQ